MNTEASGAAEAAADAAGVAEGFAVVFAFAEEVGFAEPVGEEEGFAVADGETEAAADAVGFAEAAAVADGAGEADDVAKAGIMLATDTTAVKSAQSNLFLLIELPPKSLNNSNKLGRISPGCNYDAIIIQNNIRICKKNS